MSLAASGAGGAGGAITAEMFSSAINSALTRAQAADAPVAQSAASSSSQSPAPRDDFSAQLQRMHEMGLLDDALNVRALLICAGALTVPNTRPAGPDTVTVV